MVVKSQEYVQNPKKGISDTISTLFPDCAVWEDGSFQWENHANKITNCRKTQTNNILIKYTIGM